MKFQVFFTALFFSVVNLFAQGTDSAGISRFYYPNGKISSEGKLMNGKPDGYWISYFESGRIKSEGNRLNFRLDSLWKFYNDSGFVTAEYNYKEGLKHGLQKSYYDNGILQSEEKDSLSVKNGLFKLYTSEGKIFKSIPYSNGVENGLAKEFRKDGIIITVTNFKNGYFQKEDKINRVDKNGLRQGLYRDYFANDKVQFEGNYKDDKKDGFFKEYNSEGRVVKKEEYRMGVLIPSIVEDKEKFEIKRRYYPTGATKIVGTYKKGVPEGVFRMYDEKGNIDSAKVFAQGKLLRIGRMDNLGLEQGEWKEYYESGQLRAIGNYVDGKRDGLWKFSYENDSLEQMGAYLKGKPVGAWKWFYPDGSTRREESYKNGLEDGLMKEYSDNGKVMAEGNYVDGKQDGDWKYSIGEYVAEGKFIEGKEDGVWKQFFDDGKLAFEGEFIEGQETGVHKFYWPNSRLREIRSYRLGLPDGEWIVYDENGAEVLKETYSSGNSRKIETVATPEGE